MIEYSTTCYVGDIAIICDMKYDPDKPAQMSLTFYNADETTAEWVMGRDLFKDALCNKDSGQGEVMMFVNEKTIKLSLIAPGGKALVIFRRDVVEDFVDEMYTLVPEGMDVYDMSDETLQNWLDSFA